MWPGNLRSSEAMDTGIYPPGRYPERDEELDCSFYLRIGLCRFGLTCCFNHPPNRKLAVALHWQELENRIYLWTVTCGLWYGIVGLAVVCAAVRFSCCLVLLVGC